MDTIHLPLTLLTKAPGPGLQIRPQGNQLGPSRLINLSGPSRLLNPRSQVRLHLQSLPSLLGTSPLGPS